MRILKLGDRGKEVLDVQSRLLALGYDVGTDGVDGLFGSDTQAAVLFFQQANGLLVDGIVAANTWQELVESGYQAGERLLYLKIPSFRGADVLALQRSLNRLGFNAGPEDGIFGPLTERAVLDFQKNAGLVVDGMVDESVLKAMSKVTKDGEPHTGEAKIPDRNGGYAAGRSLESISVVIDAGHGGDDPGIDAPGGVLEKDLNLQAALLLGRALKQEGSRIFFTRESDKSIDLYERAALANSWGGDLFISIHHNSCSSPSAQGSAAYFFCRQGYFSEPGKLLAWHVVNSLSRKMDVPVLPPIGRNYAVLRETEMTAVLVEPIFLPVPGSDIMLDEKLTDREVKGILEGLRHYFSLRLA